MSGSCRTPKNEPTAQHNRDMKLHDSLRKAIIPKEALKHIEQLQAELEKLRNSALYAQNKQLRAELEKARLLKGFIIETFRQHLENKWNWSDEDVLDMIRQCVLDDEEYEALGKIIRKKKEA